MCRTIGLTLIAVLALGDPGWAQDAALKKRIDLGHLGEFFELVDVHKGAVVGLTQSRDALILTLRAKKAVDPSDLSFKVGCFNGANTLIRSRPFKLEAFPLEKGEKNLALFEHLLSTDPGGKIVIRESAKGRQNRGHPE
jgi:hypothetical protein